jgi:hypothetical protein
VACVCVFAAGRCPKWRCWIELSSLLRCVSFVFMYTLMHDVLYAFVWRACKMRHVRVHTSPPESTLVSRHVVVSLLVSSTCCVHKEQHTRSRTRVHSPQTRHFLLFYVFSSRCTLAVHLPLTYHTYLCSAHHQLHNGITRRV